MLSSTRTGAAALAACRIAGGRKRDLTTKTLEVVKATLPAVAKAGTGFTGHFYERMFKQHPELLHTFNRTNQMAGKQQTALFNAIAASAICVLDHGTLPVDLLEPVNHKHCALNVLPAQYDVVGENILGTITELLNPGQEVLDAWGELYGALAGHCIKREEEIWKVAESCPGGWRGLRKFTLTEKEHMSKSITRFTFAPEDGQPISTYSPGQYTTVWLHPKEWEYRQPRHYSLISDTGAGTYSIAVKKEEKGLVSSYLHDRVAVGDTFDLSAPFGNCSISNLETLWTADPDAPVVLMSAGVGVTQTLSMLGSMKHSTGSHEKRPVTWLHSAKNGQEHAFRSYIVGLAKAHPQDVLRRVWYSEPLPDDVQGTTNTSPYHFQGRMDLSQVQDNLHLSHPDTRYFFCGPVPWMKSIAKQLTEMGVPKERLSFEIFGPHDSIL